MQATNSTGSILSPEPAIEKRLDRAGMPPPSTTTRHEEKHTSHSEILRDIIIGFSDGLTVPFALTAGLSSLGDSHLVVIGGLAELFSGAISMGIGGYLAASTERQHYLSEQAREREEVICQPEEEREEIYGIMEKYGISREASTPLVEQLSRNPEQWVRFMMDFELRLEFQTANRAWVSAVAMGLSYFIGGLVPMIPYFALQNATHALFVSIGITAVILLVFGYIKSWITIRKGRATIWGAFQTLLVGAIAAGTSYGIVRALDSHSSS